MRNLLFFVEIKFWPLKTVADPLLQNLYIGAVLIVISYEIEKHYLRQNVIQINEIRGLKWCVIFKCWKNTDNTK